MEVIDKDVLHVDEFFREFLITRICTKNAFTCGAGRLHFVRQFLQSLWPSCDFTCVWSDI